MTRFWRLVATTSLMLAGCGPGGAIVAPAHIRMTPPVDGKLTVEGGLGAVTGEGVTTVTLTVLEALPSGYRVQHVGSHLPVTSGYAAVSPDGSFASVTMGAADRPVKSGDELVLTPQAGLAQAGRPVTVIVP